MEDPDIALNRLAGVNFADVMGAPSSSKAGSHLEALEMFYRGGGRRLHLHGEGEETHSRSEVGAWLTQTGVRDEILICSQICHDGWDSEAQEAISRFSAEAVSSDISTDLKLLKTTRLDMVYFDDRPEMPLESVIEALGREAAAGRIGGIGVRNFTAARLRAACDLAATVCPQGITALFTTELALLKPAKPLWPGYVPFTSELERTVAERSLHVYAHFDDINTGQCLFGDADALSRSRAAWVERWHTEENLRTADRIRSLARERNSTTRALQIAWLLARPFRATPVISL